MIRGRKTTLEHLTRNCFDLLVATTVLAPRKSIVALRFEARAANTRLRGFFTAMLNESRTLQFALQTPKQVAGRSERLAARSGRARIQLETGTREEPPRPPRTLF
jgi:hypothetical protein